MSFGEMCFNEREYEMKTAEIFKHMYVLLSGLLICMNKSTTRFIPLYEHIVLSVSSPIILNHYQCRFHVYIV